MYPRLRARRAAFYCCSRGGEKYTESDAADELARRVQERVNVKRAVRRVHTR